MVTKTRKSFSWAAFLIAMIQFIMTQGVVFILSLIIRIDENLAANHSGWFALLLSACYTLGVYSIGGLALRMGWLRMPALWLPRLIGTFLGAGLPLLAGLLISSRYEPGHPAFFIAMITAVLGFYLPGWWRQRRI